MGTIEVIQGIVALLSVAQEAMNAAQQASANLGIAHKEAWPAGDPRWKLRFAELDAALAKATARLT